MTNQPLFKQYITVKTLKQLLQEIPDDALVILASDGEGNTLSPAMFFTAEATYMASSHNSPEGLIFTPQMPGYHKRRARRAVVLWPSQ